MIYVNVFIFLFALLRYRYTIPENVYIKYKNMKNTALFLALLIVNISWVNAQENVDYMYASEVATSTGTQVVIPDDITWTQRYILSELKELRTELERTKRELNVELNNRELESVDRALSYSSNTVNFLWLIITMAVTGFWLVGWRTMKDVRVNLWKNFEKEVQKSVRVQQKKLEEFMSVFQEQQMAHSAEILENQENIKKKQEWAYYWSQFNREEDLVIKLELLDKILNLALEENDLIVLVEKAQIYIALWLWDKSLENAEKWLEIASENIPLLQVKAISFVMLENTEEALRVITNILVMKPSAKEELIENTLLEELKDDILDISNELGV